MRLVEVSSVEIGVIRPNSGGAHSAAEFSATSINLTDTGQYESDQFGLHSEIAETVCPFLVAWVDRCLVCIHSGKANRPRILRGSCGLQIQ